MNNNMIIVPTKDGMDKFTQPSYGELKVVCKLTGNVGGKYASLVWKAALDAINKNEFLRAWKGADILVVGEYRSVMDFEPACMALVTQIGNDSVWHLDYLYVGNDYINKMLETALVASIVKIAAMSNVSLVHVNCGEVDKSLYTKLGFHDA